MPWFQMQNSGVCLRCTVGTRNKSSISIDSLPFRFQGCECSLYYNYYDGKHFLGLLLDSFGARVPPFDLCVLLERGGGEIVMVSWESCLPDEIPLNDRTIWEEQEDVVLRAFPDFHENRILKFLVVLTPKRDFPPDDSNSKAVQTTLLSNTVSSLQSLSQDFAELMIDDSHQDVEFHCGDESIKAHKAIVCKRSPVIASMLASDMVEGRTGVVNIPNMELDTFKPFLKHIYTGQMPELTVDLALSLYEAGDQYAVPGLVKRCSEYLAEHLTTENACRVLVIANAHSGKELRESVISFILDTDIPLCEHWQDFCNSQPKLAMEVLNRFFLKSKKR